MLEPLAASLPQPVTSSVVKKISTEEKSEEQGEDIWINFLVLHHPLNNIKVTNYLSDKLNFLMAIFQEQTYLQ